MAISFIAGTTMTVSGFNLQGTAPTGIQTNDVMVASIACTSGSITVAAPDASWKVINSGSPNPGSLAVATWYKVATSGDTAGTTYTWGGGAMSQAALARGGIACFRGASTTTPVDTSTAQFASASTAPSAAALTGLASAADMLVCAFGMGGTTFVYPAGIAACYTAQQYVGGVSYGNGMGYLLLSSTSSSAETGSMASGDWMAVAIALLPPTSAQPPLRSRKQSKRVSLFSRKHSVHARPLWKLPLSSSAFPVLLRHKPQHLRFYPVRAKPPVKNRFLDLRLVRAYYDFPEIIRHRGQHHRLYASHAKRPVNNRWIVDRQVTAPHADFSPILRRRSQHHRLFVVRPTKPLRSAPLWKRFNVLLAQFPEIIRHRGQLHRIYQTHAKRPVTNRLLDARLVRAYYDFPEILRRRGQQHRIPTTKAKRPVRNRWLIDQFSPLLPLFPPILRHKPQQHRIQTGRIKKPVQNRFVIERLISAPPGIFPPAMRHSHFAKRRAIIVMQKRPLHGGKGILYATAPPATIVTILQDLADLRHISAGLYRRKVIA